MYVSYIRKLTTTDVLLEIYPPVYNNFEDHIPCFITSIHIYISILKFSVVTSQWFSSFHLLYFAWSTPHCSAVKVLVVRKHVPTWIKRNALLRLLARLLCSTVKRVKNHRGGCKYHCANNAKCRMVEKHSGMT